jgi:hypothetical protein
MVQNLSQRGGVLKCHRCLQKFRSFDRTTIEPRNMGKLFRARKA